MQQSNTSQSNCGCPYTQRLLDIGRHFTPHNVKQPVRVTVTGAAGNIGYALLFMIGQGRLLGPKQQISLTLLEIPQVEAAMEGVLMELRDCALPLLTEIKGTSSYEVAFKDCQIAILVGAKPRGPGMERKDLLGQNAQIFKGQGEAINKYADRNVKVVVVGNPANTNAMICSHFAPDIPKENFTALTRLDQNRAEYQIAAKINSHPRDVKNVIIWGNHSATQYPDVNFGYVQNYPEKGFKTPLYGAISDEKWIQDEFVKTVAQRGAAIIKQRKLSSAASAANAVCDHIHDWLVGTIEGQYVSMAVMSDGSYGIPRDICFSFPVTCNQGKWQIVQGFKWSEFSKKMIETTTKELVEEKTMALEYLNSKK